MKVRRIENGNVVWFNSAGKNGNVSIKSENFSEADRYIADSLQQKLSNIKNEIWFAIQYGLPLCENQDKLNMDFAVMQIVTEFDVEVLSFDSNRIGNTYTAAMKLKSQYGEIELTI